MTEILVNVTSTFIFFLFSLLIYRHGKKKPIRLHSLVGFGFFSSVFAGYVVYLWLSRDVYNFMYSVSSLPYLYTIIFFIFKVGIELLNWYARVMGESSLYFDTKIFFIMCLFLLTSFFPKISAYIIKLFVNYVATFKNENVRISIKKIAFFIKIAAKILLGNKKKIIISPNKTIFIASLQGALIGIGVLLIILYFDAIVYTRYTPEIMVMTYMVLIGPWHFLLRLAAAFHVERQHCRKEIRDLLKDFPSPIAPRYHDLNALYGEYRQSPRSDPLPLFARFLRNAANPRSAPPWHAEEQGCLISEAMGRTLAVAMARQVQQQLDLGRTVMVIGPAAWQDALAPLARRGARNTGAALLQARLGRCVGHGVPRLVFADFQTLDLLAGRWPRTAAGAPLTIDLLVAIGLEHAEGRLRVDMAMIYGAMGGPVGKVWAQAKPRQQSEAAVRDLLLWPGRLTETALHPRQMRWPDYLLIWADAPPAVPPPASSGAGEPLAQVESGTRPDAALRLAMMARRRKIPCAFNADPLVRDADALEQLWRSRPDSFRDPGLQLPDTVFRYRPGLVQIVHSHGNIADALNVPPARSAAEPWMLHILTSPDELPPALAALFPEDGPPPDQAELAPWEPLAPQPLGGVVEWARALRQAMSRPNGLGLNELETVFLNHIPPGVIDGFASSHPLGGAVGMVERVFGPTSGVRLGLTSGGAARLFASPEPPERRPAMICLNASPPYDLPLDIADNGLTYASGTLVRYGGKTFRVGHVGPDRITVSHEEPREPISRREYRFDRSYRLDPQAVAWEWGPYRGLVARTPDVPVKCGHFHASIERRTERYVEYARNRPDNVIDVALPEPIVVSRRFVSAGWFRFAPPTPADTPALRRLVLEQAWAALRLRFPGLAQRCAVIVNGVASVSDPTSPLCVLENPEILHTESTQEHVDLLVVEDSETDLGVVRALIRHPEFLKSPVA